VALDAEESVADVALDAEESVADVALDAEESVADEDSASEAQQDDDASPEAQEDEEQPDPEPSDSDRLSPAIDPSPSADEPTHVPPPSLELPAISRPSDAAETIEATSDGIASLSTAASRDDQSALLASSPDLSGAFPPLAPGISDTRVELRSVDAVRAGVVTYLASLLAVGVLSSLLSFHFVPVSDGQRGTSLAPGICIFLLVLAPYFLLLRQAAVMIRSDGTVFRRFALSAWRLVVPTPLRTTTAENIIVFVVAFLLNLLFVLLFLLAVVTTTEGLRYFAALADPDGFGAPASYAFHAAVTYVARGYGAVCAAGLLAMIAAQVYNMFVWLFDLGYVYTLRRR